MRDYGTARWEGGDAACEHAPQMGKAFSSGTWRNGKDYSGAQKVLSRDCACGARRIDAQLGLEPTPDAYIAAMVGVFREVRRVLRDDGTCWVNVGDSFSSGNGKRTNNNGTGASTLKNDGRAEDSRLHSLSLTKTIGMELPEVEHGLASKQLLLMPARLALALQADGWWVRSDIIWAKPNPMPESVTDRCVSAHEHIFMLAKSGSSTYWMHRDHAGSRTQPPPDYRWVHKTTREERDSDPGDPETWRRINLWRGHAYFYDADAVREEASDVSLVRIAQPNFAQQTGGPKDYGTTGVNASRSMRRTLENFAANPGRNLRNVWTIATAPFSDWGETVRQVRVARDAGVDGMKRKASPDCPAHGDHPAPAANADDDAHADGSLSHIARNGGRLVQEQAGGFAPTGPHHMLMNERQSSDLPLLGYGPSAMLHSNRSHRTDLAPATSPACSAAAETDDGTARTSEPQVSVGSADRTLRSNSEPGDLGGSPSNRTASRIAHTPGEQALSSASDPSLCTCEWYIEKTEKTSHFATFPPELAARCIKAGSSERGCCAACGAPWVRVTETTRTKDLTRHTGRAAVGCDDRTDSDWPRMIATATTTGWSPSCRCRSDACDAPYQVEPCTVLDPFSGAGTALLVADRLGRDAVGIDLSHAYVEMTKERLHADCPLFMDIGPSPPPAEDPEDARMADLFDVAADQSLIGRGCRYRMAGSTGRLAR